MLKSKVNRLTSSLIAGLVLALPGANVTADTFSAGGGWPFILAPTITLKQGNNIEYYANYKLGLDDGFTAGVQWAEGHHVWGGFVGAVGARKTDLPCGSDPANCPAFHIVITDRKTTQGLGLSYEYRFFGVKEGWALRLEAGYGKASGTDAKRMDGNLQVVYHFEEGGRLLR